MMLLVIVIFSYFIADVFLDLYKMTIDTIFLCFAEDSKHNNGKDKPYFMSDEFKQYMDSTASNAAKEEEAKNPKA